MFSIGLCILPDERGVGRRGQIYRAWGGAVPELTTQDVEPFNSLKEVRALEVWRVLKLLVLFLLDENHASVPLQAFHHAIDNVLLSAVRQICSFLPRQYILYS